MAAKSTSRVRRGGVSGESRQEEDFTNCPKKVVPKDDVTQRQLREAIKENFLTAHLNREDQQDVFNAMFPVANKKKGDIIIRQGEEGNTFYIVDRGTVEVLVDDQKVGTIEQGGCFGELALIYGTPRAATIRVVSATASFWGIDGQSYRRILMWNTIEKRRTYCQFLKNVPVLADLDEWQIQNLADALDPVEFEVNEVVLHEDDSGDCFYIITAGEAEVTRRSCGQVNILKTSDYFGEVALIKGGSRRATVTAVSPLECVRLDLATFERVLGPVMELLESRIEKYQGL